MTDRVAALTLGLAMNSERMPTGGVQSLLPWSEPCVHTPGSDLGGGREGSLAGLRDCRGPPCPMKSQPLVTGVSVTVTRAWR